MPHLRENLDLVQIITACSVVLKLVGGGGGGGGGEGERNPSACRKTPYPQILHSEHLQNTYYIGLMAEFHLYPL